ncbi:integrase family protein [Nostoc sp. NIES-4103]|nr:integrase family protein [Nostoc sp. NIES-4103]
MNGLLLPFFLSRQGILLSKQRLKRKTGIAVHPHIFRHTHATELIRQGVGMAYVQKRLDHASIQTTINTYVHVSNEDMKRQLSQYLSNRYDAESESNSEPE